MCTYKHTGAYWRTINYTGALVGGHIGVPIKPIKIPVHRCVDVFGAPVNIQVHRSEWTYRCTYEYTGALVAGHIGAPINIQVHRL